MAWRLDYNLVWHKLSFGSSAFHGSHTLGHLPCTRGLRIPQSWVMVTSKLVNVHWPSNLGKPLPALRKKISKISQAQWPHWQWQLNTSLGCLAFKMAPQSRCMQLWRLNGPKLTSTSYHITNGANSTRPTCHFSKRAKANKCQKTLSPDQQPVSWVPDLAAGIWDWICRVSCLITMPNQCLVSHGKYKAQEWIVKCSE